ncbi:hypothetical protein P3372_27230, partial [Vibrio parahaemolyticus]|nr:hypothetical protein [Vibrio parahaemolyticus]
MCPYFILTMMLGLSVTSQLSRTCGLCQADMIASIFSLLQEIPLSHSQVKKECDLKETCNIYI